MPAALPLRDFLGQRRPVNVQIVDLRHRTIGANAHMILTADIHRMVDMRHHVLGMGMAGDVEERHEVNADEAAALCHQSQLGIGLVSRQIGYGTATGVVDRDRRGGSPRGIETGLLTTVRKIDHHVARIEPCDDLVTKRRQAAVFRRHRAITQLIGRVIGELKHSHAQVGKDVDALGIVSHHGAILEAVNQPDLVLGLGPANVGSGQHFHHVAIVLAYQGIGGGDVAHAGLERVI